MDVLGAVSSAVALAEIFTKSVLTTKKLWDEAQGVPEEINRLMNDLTHLRPMLEEAEAVFIDQAQNPSTDTALLLMHNYKEVSGKLHLLAADLNQQIMTAKKGKRNLAKLKATLSKTLIKRYQRELDSISQTLSFFFNVHNLHSQKESQTLHLQSISLHRNTDDKVCQLLSLVQSHLLPQTLHSAQPSRLEEDPNIFNGDMVEDVIELLNQNDPFQGERRRKSQKPEPIAWRQRRLFGGYTYQTSKHPGKPATQVLQVRLEFPWCLSGRAWDFGAYSSSMGWNMSIRPWTTRPNSDLIFKLVIEGSWPEIAELFNSGQASISDRNEFGESLLEIALQNSRFGVARSLINMGFEIEGSGLLESLGNVCVRASLWRFDKGALDWFQFAAELGLLETLSDKMFNPMFNPINALDIGFIYVCDYAWKIPEVLSLFVTERTAFHGEVSIPELFVNLLWFRTDPRLFLELCRNRNIGPQFCRESIMKATRAASMVVFARAYFLHAPGRTVALDNVTDFQYWRELSVWIFTDISMDELVWQPSDISDTLTSSPFLAGLYYEVQNLYKRNKSPRHIRLRKRRLTWTMVSWLEDVHASGIDLSEYGQRQLEIHSSSHRSFDRWSNLVMLRPEDDRGLYGPRLMSFTFGPRPQDWKLIWDPDVEEFAGDFWELTENPPLHIPGAYLEDD